MLRSFQYTESSYLEQSMFGNIYRDKEVSIARRFVKEHHIADNMDKECPICGNKKTQYFYTKWKVDYLRCSQCRSIIAVCEENTVRQYHSNSDLVSLRLSDSYQNQAFENRKQVWEEFIEWLEVRTFRFLHRNKGLSIVDVGNRFREYSKLIRSSSFCGEYNLRRSALGKDEDTILTGRADLVLYLDQLQKETDPHGSILELSGYLKEDGILVLSTRAGSGFDIITLKENNDKIYPYEHILLPSVKGIIALLEQSGLEVLEITTPGVMDVKYVMDSLDKLDESEEFVHYLLEESGQGVLQEFQRFLQKSCLSSFVCVIARRSSRKGKKDV